MYPMKFRAHETFFIRKGWLSKGMEKVALKPDLFVDKAENPMDSLGIGANMVKALRYWLQAVGLTYEETKGKHVQKLTTFGNLVFRYDPFLEELGTLFLLQYKLANQLSEATAWYFFFNVFSMSEFTREDFVVSLQNYIMMENYQNGSVALRSLSDDFTCIVNTYLPRYKSSPGRVSPENNIDCPLGELGLIDISNRKQKTYKKATPSAKSISPWVILAVIMANAKGRTEISLSELLNTAGNIGKVFNLDSITMLDLLHSVENLGTLKLIRTAGLDVVHLLNTCTFDECVASFYNTIDG